MPRANRISRSRLACFSIAGLVARLLIAPSAHAFVTPAFVPGTNPMCPALRVLEGAWRASARTHAGVPAPTGATTFVFDGTTMTLLLGPVKTSAKHGQTWESIDHPVDCSPPHVVWELARWPTGKTDLDVRILDDRTLYVTMANPAGDEVVWFERW